MAQQVSLASMLAAMTGVSVTQGWDAVCAMSLDQLNCQLFQAWLNAVPGQSCASITSSVQVDAATQVQLDVQVGPPLLEFTGQDQCQVSMWIAGGAATVVQGGVTTQLLTLAPNACQITGAIALSAMSGLVVDQGQGTDVAVNMGKGTFAVSAGGLGPVGSPQVAAAIADFFADNNLCYPLASVPFVDAAGYDALTPVSLSFATQADAAGNSCLLVLITTKGGTAGTATSLDFAGGVPIPAGYSATLLISSQALFSGVLATQLTTLLSGWEGIASGVPPAQAGGAWAVASDGGVIGLGTLTGHYSSHLPWHTDPIGVPASGLVIGVKDGGLAGSWNTTWSQGVHFKFIDGDTMAEGFDTINVAAEVAGITFSLSVQDGAISQTIQISATEPAPAASYSLPATSPFMQVLEDIFGTAEEEESVGAKLAGKLVAPLQQAFTVDLAPFSVFALANLLFGSRDIVLTLQDAYAPGDLLITGMVNASLLVTPTSAWASAGQSVPFSVLVPGSVIGPVQWFMSGGALGTIDSDGIYTAPLNVAENHVDLVVCAPQGDQPVVGYAQVLVAAPLTVSPTAAQLTPGQSVQFAASQGGTMLTSDVSWSTPGPGSVVQDGTYTAPTQITGTQQVTLTAQLGAGGPTQTAVITLCPSIST